MNDRTHGQMKTIGWESRDEQEGSEDGMANEGGRTDFMLKDDSRRLLSAFCLSGVLRIKQGHLSRLKSVAARR